MDLRRLQVFVKVYAYKSFTRAAEEVLLSQPTVSNHIKSLEEELGVLLFDRLGHEILPTSAARILYNYAVRILNMVDEAINEVDASWGQTRGYLFVGASSVPGEYLLPEIISRFCVLYPKININLEIRNTYEVFEKILSGEVEIGLVSTNSRDSRLICTPVMKNSISLIGWWRHPLLGKEIEKEEILSLPLILREEGSGIRFILENALKKINLSLNDFKTIVQVGSSMAVVTAVVSRIGVGFVNQDVVLDFLRLKRLVKLKIKGLQLNDYFYLVTRRGRSHSSVLKAFIAFCLAEFSEENLFFLNKGILSGG